MLLLGEAGLGDELGVVTGAVMGEGVEGSAETGFPVGKGVEGSEPGVSFGLSDIAVIYWGRS